MVFSNTQQIRFLKGLPAAGTPCSTRSLPQCSYDFKRIGDVPPYKVGVQIFSSLTKAERNTGTFENLWNMMQLS